MLTLLRYFLSILVLPVLVVVIIPAVICTAWGCSTSYLSMSTPLIWLMRGIGVVTIVLGLMLFGWCVCLFAQVGKGTLAPWDPTRNLVVQGPYQYVRNPMIIGVIMLLFGQALFWGPWQISIWAGGFLLGNHLYFVFLEEPELEKRFGEPYRSYKAQVPRWIPRLKPWKLEQADR
jgi:protein-S-isoprenylcysteine O-methyltransferase Ste14